VKIENPLLFSLYYDYECSVMRYRVRLLFVKVQYKCSIVQYCIVSLMSTKMDPLIEAQPIKDQLNRVNSAYLELTR